MKKRLCSVVLALLLAFSLTACGSTVDTNVNSLPANDTSSTADVVADIPAPAVDADEEESSSEQPIDETPPAVTETASFNISDVPTYNGRAYVTVNGNFPYFTDSEKPPRHLKNIAPWIVLGDVVLLMPALEKILCQQRNVVLSVL